MPLYRGAQAELRRVTREARWVLAGVFLDGRFYPAHKRVQPASVRLYEAGLARVIALPDFIAPEEHVRSVAMALAAPWAADAATADEREVLIGGRGLRIDL